MGNLVKQILFYDNWHLTAPKQHSSKQEGNDKLESRNGCYF